MIEKSDPALTRPVLVVVEGEHDVQFMRRISRTLHQHRPELPDLVQLETAGQIVFVPTGGDLRSWAQRLAALPHPQFFLCDRETPAVAAQRHPLIEALNQRPACAARLTAMRACENYLHSSAVREVCSIAIEINDDDDVAELLARKVLELTRGPNWEALPRRGRTRLRNRIKRTLNTVAVERMTPALLSERDPASEVAGWLQAVASLLSSTETRKTT